MEERRSEEGRRECDGVCPVHDEIRGNDIACFETIKRKIRDMEIRMDKFISRGVIGIIATVAIGLLIIIIGMSGSRMGDIHKDVKDLVNSVSELNNRSTSIMLKQERISTVQESILKDILKLQQALDHRDPITFEYREDDLVLTEQCNGCEDERSGRN